MSKAKQKHKAKPSQRENLEFLLDVFSVVSTHLLAHPELNEQVRTYLGDAINDISNSFNNTPQDWALGNRFWLMRALHNAQKPGASND